MSLPLSIPDGKDFIFSVFDDTDVSTLGNIRPVYEFLYEQGLLTTKSVWPLHDNSKDSDYFGSQTLEDPDYADYVKRLAERGFEIAFHGAGMESSRRDRTAEALEYFNSVLGFYPRTYASHAGNSENLYWGIDRFTFPVFKWLHRLLTSYGKGRYSGHIEGSPYFWGDLCREHIDYVRTFTFDRINLLDICRFPYQVPGRPWIKNCFITHFADHVEEFNRLISEKNIDTLEQKRGVLIVSTHFGKGFVKQDTLNPVTRKRLKSLAARNGYFVPVSTILDHLNAEFGNNAMEGRSLYALEWRWWIHSLRQKMKRCDYEKSELPYLGLE